MTAPTTPLALDYDVIVVGSGFGGGAAAYTLSRAGLRTLLLERGPWPLRDDGDWSGRQILLDGRYQAESPISVRQYGRAPKDAIPNAVVGGNSVFFGGATLRLRVPDFATWPFGYDHLEPYYGEAEAILGVHGNAGEDPCEPPRSRPYPAPAEPLTTPAQRLFEAARAVGFHPFSVPTAIDFQGLRGAACIRCATCDGFPCKVSAKNDVAMTFLARADHAHLQVVAGATVVKVLMESGRASGVEVLDKATKRTHNVRARAIVMAAGAVHSPAVLLRSGLQDTDRSGLMGRNLMRHCNAMVGYVFRFETNPEKVNHKQICITDLHEQERNVTGRAVGVIQDMMMPPADVVRVRAPRGFRVAAYTLAAHIQTLICIAEDDAQPANRVLVSDRRDDLGIPITAVEHSYSNDDVRRRNLLIKAARKVLRRAGGLVGKVSLVDSFSHAVGSLRMGADSATSVVNPDGALHGVPNVFVTDGSFMPTSGGVNPSLTIAANALRVSERVAHFLGASHRAAMT